MAYRTPSSNPHTSKTNYGRLQQNSIIMAMKPHDRLDTTDNKACFIFFLFFFSSSQRGTCMQLSSWRTAQHIMSPIHTAFCTTSNTPAAPSLQDTAFTVLKSTRGGGGAGSVLMKMHAMGIDHCTRDEAGTNHVLTKKWSTAAYNK